MYCLNDHHAQPVREAEWSIAWMLTKQFIRTTADGKEVLAITSFLAPVAIIVAIPVT